ncbi:hypothetical protein SAMN02745164_01493 [Marinitoga hydrogenitolerans DSM 16785]|uniref:Outer membrane protein beta-barrel domain-containing protein n=1 Tax=Marinitoga hydrogenitolerans (strain DSM 16785 / JCM 12826 / AT1271) TaxID=1122195 RepID=A0A1M4XQV0_MARH1|nr:hypothetical protein [Marinitoga hydrogenitolerans]SHE95984.1 hypothetical protein SAMN02745164_01493 [Marinitoga hydrogenitolerans DSM 16785]
MKKKLIFLFIILLLSFGFSFNLMTIGTYGITSSSTSLDIANWDDSFKKFDYYSLKIGIMYPAEDSPEMLFGPYFGYTIYDNITQSQLKELNSIIENIGYELGIMTIYNTEFLFNTKFNVLALGGIHTEDQFKSLSSLININIGLSYKITSFNIFFFGGYESRYFTTDNQMVTINYIPVSLGVEVLF